MAYHINFAGEVGRCTAQRACPFGSFETDHYTTEEQARRAYELSMEGKAIDAAQTREAYFEAKSRREQERDEALREAEAAERDRQAKEAEAEAEKKKRRDKWLRKMKTPKTIVPELGEPGYYEDMYEGVRLGTRRNGYELVSAGVETDENGPYVLQVWESKQGFQSLERLPLTEPERVWVDGHSPEDLAVYEAAVNERNAEDFYLNHMRFPFRWAVAMQDRPPAVVELSTRFRIFKDKAKELAKSGIANPYTRALEIAATTKLEVTTRTGFTPYRSAFEPESGDLLRYAVTGRGWEGYVGGLMEKEGEKILQNTFLHGHVPMVDYDPRKILQEREERGLLQS